MPCKRWQRIKNERTFVMEVLALLIVLLILYLQNRKITELNKRVQALETDLTEMGYRFKETCLDSYLVRQALMGQPVDQSEIDQIKHASRQVFPVRAVDLMPAYSGAALGAKLKELEQAWINSGFSLTKSQLCDG